MERRMASEPSKHRGLPAQLVGPEQQVGFLPGFQSVLDAPKEEQEVSRTVDGPMDRKGRSVKNPDRSERVPRGAATRLGREDWSGGSRWELLLGRVGFHCWRPRDQHHGPVP
jgi:hypothetical protein